MRKKIPAVPSYEFNRHLSSHHANNPTTTMKINFDNVLKNMVDFINKSANECVCEKRAMWKMRENRSRKKNRIFMFFSSFTRVCLINLNFKIFLLSIFLLYFEGFVCRVYIFKVEIIMFLLFFKRISCYCVGVW